MASSYRISIELKDGRTTVLPKRFPTSAAAIAASKKYRSHPKVDKVSIVPNRGQ